MKKFFVLYSLKQKFTPTLYKTRLTVVKHVRTNKSFKFEEFHTEQNAKQFIQKLTIGTKINQNQNLTQSQISEILKTIKQQPYQQSKKTEKSSYQPEQTWQKPQKPARWMILSKDHAMRNQQDEHKYDSSYSSSNLRTYDVTSFVKKTENIQKRTTKPQLENKNHEQQQRQQQKQSESSLVSQQLTTTQDLTQQRGYLNKLSEGSQHVKRSIIPRKVDKQKRQQDKLYFVVWNKHDLSKVYTAKRQEGLQEILLQLEKQNSSEWIQQNITSKQFRLKRGALSFAQQLQRQRNKRVKKVENQKQKEAFSQIKTKTNVQEQKSLFKVFQVKNHGQVENDSTIQKYPIQELSQNVQLSVKTEDYQQITVNKEQKELKIEKKQEKSPNLQKRIFEIEIKQEKLLVVKAGKVESNQIKDQVLYFSQNQISSPAITLARLQQDFELKVEEKKNICSMDLIRQNIEVQGQTISSEFQKKTSEQEKQVQEKQHIDREIKIIQCGSEAIQSQNKQQDREILGLKEEYLLSLEIQEVTTKESQLQTIPKYQNGEKFVKATQDQNSKKIESQTQYQKAFEQTFESKIQLQNLQMQKTQPEKAQLAQQSINILESQKIQAIVQSNKNVSEQKIEENENKDKKLLQTQTVQAASTCITNLDRKYSSVHPFNRAYIRKIIQNYAQKYESYEKQQQKTTDQDEYVIYPSLFISQSPGFSIGSYRVKNLVSGDIVRHQQLILGQTRKQEGNLLTLAFSLSSIGQFPGSRVKICLNQQMNNSRNYTHRFDKKVMQTKNFLTSIQSRYKKKIEYVL